MAEEGEHLNTEEPMNTQELLNTMVASQIQLREDMNHMMQQFQNLKNNQEGDNTDHDPPALESENKINERIGGNDQKSPQDGGTYGLRFSFPIPQ